MLTAAAAPAELAAATAVLLVLAAVAAFFITALTPGCCDWSWPPPFWAGAAWLLAWGGWAGAGSLTGTGAGSGGGGGAASRASPFPSTTLAGTFFVVR